ncbi:MAG: ABC-2 transporter permease [Clostridia bacterium]|nr:ABC-2 transporter permease [Clostridia bacterium]
MRGMLLWDWKRLWRWILAAGAVCAVCLWIGVSGILSAFYMQCLTIGILGMLVDGDRACRWERYLVTIPQGRRRYAAEKGIVLLLLWIIFAAVVLLCTGGIAWQVFRRPFFITCVLGLSALHFPAVILCSRTKRSVWEMLTMVSALLVTYFLRNSMSLAFRKALRAGDIPEHLEELEYIAWSDIPWEGLAWLTAVLFVLSVVGTIWLAGDVNRNEGLRAERVYGGNRKFLNHIPMLIFAVGYMVTAILALQIAKMNSHIYYEYIYTRENVSGETDYMITSMEEDRLKEKYPTDNWVQAAKYPVRQYEDADGAKSRTEIHSILNGICLIWDEEWFLWDMETEEKTILSLTTADPNVITIQLLGDTEPVIIALDNDEHNAVGFFSIAQDRMITGWDFHGWGDDLIDGQIAARIGQYEEEKWYLVDPVTGEITGTLPGRP